MPKFACSQCLRVDGDSFEIAPRVDVDLFYTDKIDTFQRYLDTDTCGGGFRQSFYVKVNILATYLH